MKNEYTWWIEHNATSESRQFWSLEPNPDPISDVRCETARDRATQNCVALVLRCLWRDCAMVPSWRNDTQHIQIAFKSRIVQFMQLDFYTVCARLDFVWFCGALQWKLSISEAGAGIPWCNVHVLGAKCGISRSLSSLRAFPKLQFHTMVQWYHGFDEGSRLSKTHRESWVGSIGTRRESHDAAHEAVIGGIESDDSFELWVFSHKWLLHMCCLSWSLHLVEAEQRHLDEMDPTAKRVLRWTGHVLRASSEVE